MAAATVTGRSGQPPGEQAVAPEEGQASCVDQHVGIDVAAGFQAPQRQLRRVLPPACTARLEAIGEHALQLADAQHAHALAHDLAVDRMAQRRPRAMSLGVDAQQASPLERRHHVRPGDHLQVSDPEGASDREQLEGVTLAAVEVRQVRSDQFVEGHRRRELSQPPHSVDGEQGRLLEGAVHDLAQHLQVAARPVGQSRRGLGVDRSVEDAMQQRGDFVGAEHGDLFHREVPVLEECNHDRRQLPTVADRGDEEDFAFDRQREEQRQRGRIEEVDVVDEQKETFTGGAVGEVLAGSMEHRRAIVVADAQVVGQRRWQEMGERSEGDRLGRRVPDGACRRLGGGGGRSSSSPSRVFPTPAGPVRTTPPVSAST